MPDVTSTTWFPVLTLLIGYGTKSLSDWIQHRRTVAREREGREAARHDKQIEQRAEFQRKTLLELQEQAHQLGRRTAQVLHADAIAYSKDKENWHKQMLDDDLAEDFRATQARLSLLVARVRDDEVRNLATQMKTCCTAVAFLKDIEGSRRAFAAMDAEYEKLNERIGKIVRDIDKTDD